jgi:hypothetical protein
MAVSVYEILVAIADAIRADPQCRRRPFVRTDNNLCEEVVVVAVVRLFVHKL